MLEYRCTNDNGLSFELLVDGKPLAALVGSRSISIPYWIIEDDLPYWPPHGSRHDPDIRIVCVCSCGEEGCGHARCRVEFEGAEVLFRDFDGDVSAEGSQKQFRFSRANYDAVVAQIVDRAREQQNQNQSVPESRLQLDDER